MDQLMRMAQSMALFRTSHMKSSLSVLNDNSSYRVLILAANYNQGRGITPSEMADYFRCSRPYISRIIKDQLKAHLLEKIPDPLDSRSFSLVCTEQGKERVGKMMDEYLLITRKLFLGLGKEKSRQFMELLEEAVRILEN